MEAISQKLTNKMFLDSKSMVFFDSIEKGSIILNLYAEYYINMDKLSNYESCSIFSSLKNMLLIKKHLLGKSPKYLLYDEISNTMTIYNYKDEYYVFSKHDVELLYDPKLNIDKDLIRMFQTLSKQDRWNLNVSNKKDDSIRINNSEFNFITKRISYKDFFMEKKDTYEIMLILNHLDFSNYLWSFTSIKDKSKLKAYIKDEDLKIRVKNGSIKFGYRDIIHCIIERNHYSILNNIDLSKAQYSIIKVLNIIHNSEQLSFDI